MKKGSAAKTGRNDHLKEALALLVQAQASLVQNQASFVQNQASFVSQMAELNRVSSERFARIEGQLAAIKAILARHEQILQSLPEAIREKIPSSSLAPQSDFAH
jgi:uncharacterized protein YllA (UPF0747 family)